MVITSAERFFVVYTTQVDRKKQWVAAGFNLVSVIDPSRTFWVIALVPYQLRYPTLPSINQRATF